MRAEGRRREVTTLDALLQALTSSLDVAEILHLVLQHAKRIIAAEGLSLLLYDRDRNELVFAATETLQENALTCRETRLPPAVGGLMSPERLIVPVRTTERVLGTIDLHRRYDGHPFDEDDRRRAAAVAAELASVVDLERVAHEPDALQAVFARLAAAVACEDAALVVYDRERRELAFRVSRALRVINDDRVAPGKGFPTHAHRDMEIITYVLDGALEHRDSMGNGSIIRPGDVQRMSAGTGVTHSEYNPSAVEPVHLLQIWLLPEREGLPPSYEQRNFAPDEKRGALRLIASQRGDDGSVTVHQDVELFAALLERGDEVVHPLRKGRHAWVQIARGGVTVDGTALGEGDGAAVTDASSLTVRGTEPAEFLLFDLA